MGGYLAYAEYKDSGIEWLGKIPTRWDAKRLKFLVAEPLKYGANEAAELTDPDLPRYIRITDVKDDGNLRDETFRSLPEDIAKDYLLEEGDILLARSGATVGKTFIYELSWGKAAYAGYLIRARMSDEVNSRFVYHFLQSNSYLEWVKSIFIQATIQNISAEKYANLWLPVPPIEEQRSIARFLDYKTAQIDALITKKETLLKKLAEKRTALISQAVTKGCDRTAPMKDSGIEWLGKIPAHWKILKLGRVCNVTKLTGFEYTKVWETDPNGEVIALRGFNIKNFRLELNNIERISLELSNKLSRSKLYAGNIVFPCTGTLGNGALIEEDDKFHINQNIAKISLNEDVDRNFILFSLCCQAMQYQINRLNSSGLQPVLLIGTIRNLTITLPPLGEQGSTVLYIDNEVLKIDQAVNRVEEVIDKLKEYRTALITNAVTGKIDVRDVILETEPMEAA